MVAGNAYVGRESTGRSIKNQGPPGLITGNSTENTLTQEQANDLKTRFMQEHTGNNSVVPVITSANLKWQAMGYPAVDLELVDLMDWSFDKLCNLYMLPSKVLNSKEASTFSNQNEATKAAYENAILPEAYELRDAWNNWLVPAWGETLWLDVDISGIGPLQEDKKELTDWLSRAYWITIADKQRLMGFTEDAKLKGVYADMNGQILSFEEEPPLDVQVDAAVRANGKAHVTDY